MKSTKIMLSGLMLMLVSIWATIIEMDRNTWLGAAALILAALAIIIFAVGLAVRE